MLAKLSASSTEDLNLKDSNLFVDENTHTNNENLENTSRIERTEQQ